MSVAELSPGSTSIEMARGAMWPGVEVGQHDGLHSVGVGDEENCSMSVSVLSQCVERGEPSKEEDSVHNICKLQIETDVANTKVSKDDHLLGGSKITRGGGWYIQERGEGRE